MSLQVFKSEQFGSVRAIGVQGEPLFCAVDVCRALGYSNSRKAIDDHVDKEDVTKHDTLTNGGVQSMSFVNESGLYSLIFGSKLETAKTFKKWVTSEVLPAIRKTGEYHTEMVDDTLERRRLDLQEKQLAIETAKICKDIAGGYEGTYKQVLEAHIIKNLTGQFLLPLPKNKQDEQETFSATEVAERLTGLTGKKITATRIGILANKNNMKVEQYGKFFKDMVTHCGKDDKTFRYNKVAIDKFVELLGR